SPAICLAESKENRNQKTMELDYNVGQEVTLKQREDAHKLLLGNHDVFGTDISEKADYRTGIALDTQEFLQKELNKMEKLGVICAVKGLWRLP
ncbi:16204_t:CDS:2, partial [Racocetra fulgida]